MIFEITEDIYYLQTLTSYCKGIFLTANVNSGPCNTNSWCSLYFSPKSHENVFTGGQNAKRIFALSSDALFAAAAALTILFYCVKRQFYVNLGETSMNAIIPNCTSNIGWL